MFIELTTANKTDRELVNLALAQTISPIENEEEDGIEVTFMKQLQKDMGFDSENPYCIRHYYGITYEEVKKFVTTPTFIIK